MGTTIRLKVEPFVYSEQPYRKKPSLFIDMSKIVRVSPGTLACMPVEYQ